MYQTGDFWEERLAVHIQVMRGQGNETPSPVGTRNPKGVS